MRGPKTITEYDGETQSNLNQTHDTRGIKIVQKCRGNIGWKIRPKKKTCFFEHLEIGPASAKPKSQPGKLRYCAVSIEAPAN